MSNFQNLGNSFRSLTGGNAEVFDAAVPALKEAQISTELSPSAWHHAPRQNLYPTDLSLREAKLVPFSNLEYLASQKAQRDASKKIKPVSGEKSQESETPEERRFAKELGFQVERLVRNKVNQYYPLGNNRGLLFKKTHDNGRIRTQSRELDGIITMYEKPDIIFDVKLRSTTKRNLGDARSQIEYSSAIMSQRWPQIRAVVICVLPEVRPQYLAYSDEKTMPRLSWYEFINRSERFNEMLRSNKSIAVFLAFNEVSMEAKRLGKPFSKKSLDFINKRFTHRAEPPAQ